MKLYRFIIILSIFLCSIIFLKELYAYEAGAFCIEEYEDYWQHELKGYDSDSNIYFTSCYNAIGTAYDFGFLKVITEDNFASNCPNNNCWIYRNTCGDTQSYVSCGWSNEYVTYNNLVGRISSNDMDNHTFDGHDIVYWQGHSHTLPWPKSIQYGITTCNYISGEWGPPQYWGTPYNTNTYYMASCYGEYYTPYLPCNDTLIGYCSYRHGSYVTWNRCPDDQNNIPGYDGAGWSDGSPRNPTVSFPLYNGERINGLIRQAGDAMQTRCDYGGYNGNEQTRLGNADLEWLILDSCFNLATCQYDEEQDKFDPSIYSSLGMDSWKDSFDGLHIVLGHWDTVALDSNTMYVGATFAENLINGESVHDAWLHAEYDVRGSNAPTAAISSEDGPRMCRFWYNGICFSWIYDPLYSTMDQDHLWNHCLGGGSSCVQPDIPRENIDGFIVTWRCDAVRDSDCRRSVFID